MIRIVTLRLSDTVRMTNRHPQIKPHVFNFSQPPFLKDEDEKALAPIEILGGQNDGDRAIEVYVKCYVVPRVNPTATQTRVLLYPVRDGEDLDPAYRDVATRASYIDTIGPWHWFAWVL